MINISFTRDEWLSLKGKNPEVYSLLNTVRNNEQSLDYCKTLDREKLKRECELGYFDITELFTKEQINNACPELKVITRSAIELAPEVNQSNFNENHFVYDGIDFSSVYKERTISFKLFIDEADFKLKASRNLINLINYKYNFFIDTSNLLTFEFVVLQIMLFKLGFPLCGNNNQVISNNALKGLYVLSFNKGVSLCSDFPCFSSKDIKYNYLTDKVTWLVKQTISTNAEMGPSNEDE